MANLTAEQYDTLQEMLKVITEARQTSERLSESWAKWSANPIGSHTTHLTSPITPMTPSQSPQPPDPPDLLLVDPEAAKMVDTRTQSLIDVNKQLAETHMTQLEQLQKQSEESTAWRAEIDERFMDIKNVRADPLPRESSVTLISYPTPTKPPDPPDFNKFKQNPTIMDAPRAQDYNPDLTSKTSTNKKLPLRYSCVEIYERMENGLCLFCEDLDTPGHYSLKHKRSKLCLVECVDDGLPDAELVGPAVEEISNKFVNMIREKESSPENESRPEVSVLHQVPLSQSKVTFSSLEPSHRCHNHYASLDVSDKDMGDEIEDDELQDKQIEQIVETLVMNEGEQPLDTTRHSNLPNEMATFLGLVGGDDQEDNTKFARKKNNSETKIEFSSSDPSCFVALVTTSNSVKRECRDVVLTDNGDRAWALELRFNQVGNGEIRVLNLCPAEKASKESFPVEVMHWINKKNEAEYSPNENNVYTLTSGLCQAKRDHEEIRVLEKLIQPEFSLDLLDCSSLTGLFCKPKLEVEVTVLLEGNMNIKRATFFGRNVVKWKCWLVVESRLPLHYWVAWRKLIVWEVLCVLQNNAHTLLLVLHELQKRKLCFWSSNGRIGTANGELQEWNDGVAGHFLFDMVEKSNYLDEVIEEVARHMYNIIEKVAKRFILAMIDEHKDIKTACVLLEMGLNRERLIQLGAPPVFSDLLCAMNRIQVRLKMVLLLEFLWLILFSSKMFKSSNVPQNKNQTNQKLSSYWKLLLRLLYPLHNNEWRSFYMLMIIPAFKGNEETVSFNIAVTSCSRFDFFSYSSWMVSHNRYGLSSCVLRQEKNYVMVLFPIDGTADITMDEYSSVCNLLFGVFVLNLIADQVRGWSFFGLLLQWKWHPPPQATSEFHQAHNDKPVFHL